MANKLWGAYNDPVTKKHFIDPYISTAVHGSRKDLMLVAWEGAKDYIEKRGLLNSLLRELTENRLDKTALNKLGNDALKIAAFGLSSRETGVRAATESFLVQLSKSRPDLNVYTKKLLNDAAQNILTKATA